MTTLTIDVLERWVLFGAPRRIVELSSERAVVDLCACTGEPVERMESDDPTLISYLRTAQPEPDGTDDKETEMTPETLTPTGEPALPLLRANERPPKPHARGVTEIRGPYYSVMGLRHREPPGPRRHPTSGA